MPDRDDFEEFVAARSPALLRTAYLLTGNHADAEDLVQRALIKVVPKWDRLSGEPEAYVRAILVRESVSRWRARRWREVSVERLPERASSSSSDDRIVLAAALAALPPRQRAVIVLRYFEDLTERQTSEVLGIAVGTVKSQHRDALAKLRTLVPELEQPAAETVG